MYRIVQTGGTWTLMRDGEVIDDFDTYEAAMLHLGSLIQAATIEIEVESDDDETDDTGSDDQGLLPETWVSDLCFTEAVPDGRDFSGCTWTARDPQAALVPLMFLDSTTMGHFEACLAGFFETITVGNAPTATGRFYDNDAGEALRDILLGGRRFGISVDPGAVEAQFKCTEMDEEGLYCVDGIIVFDAYEIAGATACPFPAFPLANIRLDETATTPAEAPPGAAPEPAVPVAAAAARLAGTTLDFPMTVEPPADWFTDPQLSEPTPITITDDGEVWFHLAVWGTCHVGETQVCITPPASKLGYERFYGAGSIKCEDGSLIRTGAVTWGIPHADLNASLIAAKRHYAQSSDGWGDVVMGQDSIGIWGHGRVRPGITVAEVSIIRALAMSGDWRYDDEADGLELIAALGVNVPGFKIPQAVAASGRYVAVPKLAAKFGIGMRQTALVASGIVRPYDVTARDDCGCNGASVPTDAGEVMSMLQLLERRTRHLIGPALQEEAARLPKPPPPASYIPARR